MDWDAIERAIVKAERENPTMDINSEPGTRVIFKYPNNGSEYDGNLSSEELLFNGIYTVKEVFVGGSRSYVELVEKPGMEFNTVHFANIEEELTNE